MTPKLCKAGQQLREQFDDSYPQRSRKSDGWIGDVRHQSRGSASDHNPDAHGIVRAIDITRDLFDGGQPDEMLDVADQLRLCAKRGDKRIKYIIFNHKICSAKSLWRWRAYRGINPHVRHCHVSFSRKGDNDGSFFQIPLLGGK